jgi:hypothetical protein
MSSSIDTVKNLAHLHCKLAKANAKTIQELYASADYLDKVWKDCKVAIMVGISTSIVGGALTIGSGVATILTTAGVATPLLIAGIAVTAAGSLTNITTRVVEIVINSQQIKALDGAVQQQKSLQERMTDLFEELKKKGDGIKSCRLSVLLAR